MKGFLFIWSVIFVVTFVEAKISGNVELDTYANDDIEEKTFRYYHESKFNLNFDFSISENWTALVILKVDGEEYQPSLFYDEAYVLYEGIRNFSFRIGEFAYSEGAFISYYAYDDPKDWAAGMKEHRIRGIGINWYSFLLDFGFTGDDAYDVHLAYDFKESNFNVRPYGDYKLYQACNYDEFHAGISAGIGLDAFNARIVYGYHLEHITLEKNVSKQLDLTSSAHTFLFEVSLNYEMLQVKSAFFYSIMNEGDAGNVEVVNDILERSFAYVEPSLKWSRAFILGVPLEYHSNAIEADANMDSFDLGLRFYLYPIENLNFVSFLMTSIPIDENNEDEYPSFRIGTEMSFSF